MKAVVQGKGRDYLTHLFWDQWLDDVKISDANFCDSLLASPIQANIGSRDWRGKVLEFSFRRILGKDFLYHCLYLREKKFEAVR